MANFKIQLVIPGTIPIRLTIKSSLTDYCSCGIKGIAIKVLQSYLQERKQKIAVNDSCSTPNLFPWGVPQGSVLEPLEFILYTGPLSRVISLHEEIHHVMYADDTQTISSLKLSKTIVINLLQI